MSGVLLNTQRIEAWDRMEELLSKPFMLEGLGEMAEDRRLETSWYTETLNGRLARIAALEGSEREALDRKGG